MSEGRRPGGLTALAVFNFLGSVVALFNGLSMFATPALLPRLMEEMRKRDDQDSKTAIEVFEKILQGIEDLGPAYYVLAGMALLSAVLLILSGFGYLQQKKFLGRKVGNAWALLSIAMTIVNATWASQAAGGATILIVLFLTYPLLTLFLINGTFKEDFVR